MYRLFLALRYMRARFVNFISVGGVMVGVAVLIVVTSVFDGFQEQVRATVRGTLSHLVLTPMRPMADRMRAGASDATGSPEDLVPGDGAPDDTPADGVPPGLPPAAPPADADAPGPAAPGPLPVPAPGLPGPVKPAADDDDGWRPPSFAEIERRLRAHDSRIEAVTRQIRLPIAYPYRSSRLSWARMKDQALQQMEAVGIDWPREIQVSELGRSLLSGDPANPFHDDFAEMREKTTVLVGRTWAEQFKGWGPREFVRVVKGPMDADGEPMLDHEGNLINEIRVQFATFEQDEGSGEMSISSGSVNPLIKGIYDGGDATSEMTQMYFDIDRLRAMANLRYEYFELRVRLTDYEDAAELKTSIMKAFPMFQVETWEDVKRDFLQAVATEKVMLLIVLSFIVLLGGFIILATLTLTVIEKTRDIGIMGALGATRGGILSVFLWNGLLIGVIGSLLGLGLGYWFVQNVDGVRAFVARTTDVDLFPSDIYHFRHIPTIWRWPTVLTIMGGSALIAFLAGLLPAFRASRLDPVKALRYE